MTFKTSACAIVAFSLLALCSPAISLPTEHLDQELSHENHPEKDLAAKNGERCPGNGSVRFPHSARIDLRAIDVGAEDRMLTDISSRSLTPWDSSVDTDVNRNPEVIVQANCLHSMCLDSEGQKDLRLNSIPIRHQILVLRREQKGCSLKYKLEKQWVTFGCTCVRPAVSYVSY
ncbi:interleukin-17A-like [Pleurodeles waltl]|uniref:interleukin-17A-like n=1 Tax=Pleurodeles waltl TaxID=8319 RepID=UPI00370952A3